MVEANTPIQRPKPRLFSGMMANKGYVLKASAACIAFWLIQYIYQVVAFGKTPDLAMLSSFAFAAGFLISFSLMAGPLSRLTTRFNFVFHRRTLAVWGFTFGIMHIIVLIAVILKFDISLLFLSFDPFVNPIIFGLLSFLIFLPLYLTSTDWANSRLGSKNWKTLHRLVYVGYIFLVLHFLLINPPSLQNIMGYSLIAVTILTVVLQMLAFAKTVDRTKSRTAMLVGLLILLFGAVMLYLAYS